MSRVKGLFMDHQAEVEMAVAGMVRDAKFISVAPAEMLVDSRDWIMEARELLNDALAKADRMEEAA